MTDAQRFYSKVNTGTPEGRPWPQGCWHWSAYTEGGYGRFWLNGKMVYAHRYAYELLVGPIPEGLQLDHLCRVRNCVNPAHLEPVTSRENIRRGETGQRNARKTHCPQGHPYDEANTYLIPSGGRGCRICRSASVMVPYYERKAASRG